jgi:hypothetical protein
MLAVHIRFSRRREVFMGQRQVLSNLSQAARNDQLRQELPRLTRYPAMQATSASMRYIYFAIDHGSL